MLFHCILSLIITYNKYNSLKSLLLIILILACKYGRISIVVVHVSNISKELGFICLYLPKCRANRRYCRISNAHHLTHHKMSFQPTVMYCPVLKNENSVFLTESILNPSRILLGCLDSQNAGHEVSHTHRRVVKVTNLLKSCTEAHF